MAEYIEREAVLAFLRKCRAYKFQGQLPDGRICHFSDVRQGVEDIPVADVEPVRHGWWIPDVYEYYHCSECGFEHDELRRVTLYCPNCGANMEEYEEETT